MLNLEKNQVVLLGYVPYQFEDKMGKEVSGVNAYILEAKPQYDDFGMGYVPKKVSLPYSFHNDLKGVKFPVAAEPITSTRFTSKGAKAEVSEFIIGNPVDIKMLNLQK